MYNVWEKVLLPQQTQEICITFIQRRPNVFDVGPTLHNVIQMFCVYWDVNTNLGSSSFNIPAVIQSVCLQASDQVGARAKSFELLTHRCLSSIYKLAVIWELALNEALGMKRIFSIIMEQGLGLPTGTIAFWWTLVPRILTVDHTFNMTIWCKHVHRPELHKFFNFCAAHSQVRLDIETKSPISNYWQPCQK